jgi:fatty acid desaturase
MTESTSVRIRGPLSEAIDSSSGEFPNRPAACSSGRPQYAYIETSPTGCLSPPNRLLARTERDTMQQGFDRHPASTSNREDFAELSRRIRAEGLMAPRGGYFAIKIAATTGALSILVGIVLVVGDSWWNLAVAVGLAFVLAQLGFIGHDAGHRQVCAHRRGNDVIGLILANLLTGFSFGWWLAKHNRHHAHTNAPGKDPDIAPGALVYTSDQVVARKWWGRWFARIQAILLVPLLFLEALNLHLASAISLGRRRDRAALVEAALLLIHGCIFFVAPFLVLSPVRAIVFIAIIQSLFGFYLGASFLTNHVGMPTMNGGNDLGFLRRQVLTSRNLSGRSLTGFIFGGLDTQIEHHLFPAMPRANLRRARELVRPFCAERRIAYAEQSPWRAYRDVLRHLQMAGSGRAVPTVG